MKQYFSPKEMISILSFIYEPDSEICSVLIGFLLVYFTLIKRCNPFEGFKMATKRKIVGTFLLQRVVINRLGNF